jgi:glutamate---cysteine ligase / carboxylate-amine ligase
MTRPRIIEAESELPDWATWRASKPLTIGIEEEFMLVDPRDWSLAFRSDEVISALKPDVRDRVTPETHAAVMEVTTGVHRGVGAAVAELANLRRSLARALATHGLRAAVAGMHPTAVWPDTVP